MVALLKSKVLVLLFICFYIDFTYASRRAIIHRQDGPTNPRTTSSDVSATSPSKSPQIQSSAGSNDQTTTTDQQTRSFATITPTSNSSFTSASSTATNIGTPVFSNINGAAAPTASVNLSTFNSTLTPNKLPLDPSVTPGLAVAGVILMITGLAYTVVGVKNKWLQISLSAGYLASLAVTVLILYVMNPPVSNAIQGAYVVAVVMTGVILGGAATIFQEMTEGLGCLLGGFAISMWLLVLKPGGILTSTSSIAIFIVAFTLAGFSTSFSHYTRPYGLIILIPFGGATALVLGIDCFSRAGLKEFWAYLWNLNDSLFPLGATTYPITRGMKVEIAAIIIIFLIGVVSQMKLWKIIRERREKRASERLQDERTLGHDEEHAGGQEGNTTVGSRDQWDKVEGNRPGKSSGRDSGVGDMESQKKGPTSTVTSVRRSDEDIEMSEMRSPTTSRGVGLVMATNGQSGGPVTIRVARDVESDTVPELDGYSVENGVNRLIHLSHVSGHASPEESKVWVMGADGEARLERRPSGRDSKRVSASPAVVPLPFTVPEGNVEDDRSSVATFADDEETARKRQSKHLSVGSMLMRKLSGKSMKSQRDSKVFSTGNGVSTDDLIIPRAIDDDRASSVAATMDGLSDDEEMRSARSSLDFGPDTRRSVRFDTAPATPTIQVHAEVLEHSVSPTAVDVNDEIVTRPISAASLETATLEPEPPAVEKNIEELEAPMIQQSLTSSTDPKVEVKSDVDEEASDEMKQKAAPSVVSAVELHPASVTKEKLPPQLSKVVMSYRTNEWAKHLSAADQPELDELQVVQMPADIEDTENAAPVNVEDLQQTAESSVRPLSRATSQASNLGNPSVTRSGPSMSKAHPPSTSLRHNAQQDNVLVRSASQLSINSQVPPRNFRSSSGPIIPQQIVESPIEDDPSSDSAPQSNNPFGAGNTLMAKRDTMLRSKPSYLTSNSNLSTTLESASNSNLTSRTGSDAGSIYNHPLTPKDEDNMSLSERRNMIRQSSLHAQPQLYDSHQPKRQSSTPTPMAREQQLASWRASVQQDLNSTVQPRHTIERSRSALWQERQQEEQKRMWEDRKRGEREGKFDERMRRGDMLDAHREAMRRMQAGASKRA